MATISQELAGLHLDQVAQDALDRDQFDAEPPPAPILKSPGVVATDITKQFIGAAKELEIGQLVKEPYFTLFESVGALEIMDKKMDSGYLEVGETMEDEFDFMQTLLPDEIIGVIDQLLRLEMAWHIGHPLAQTIFTSLYVDRELSLSPQNILRSLLDESGILSKERPLSLQVLRIYCIGLIKTCCCIRDRVKSEHFYEEEDFVTHTFNRNLHDTLDVATFQNILTEAIDHLMENQDIKSEFKQALRVRLMFRYAFLDTVSKVDSPNCPEIKALWTSLLALVPDIKSSTKLGKPVPHSFSIKIQRKLASTVPPRPIIEISQQAAFDHLERLCRDGAAVADVLKYHNSHSLMKFVALFQARKPQPSVYIRTLLQHYLFGGMVMLGTMSVRMVLDDDLAATVLPAHKLLDRTNDEIEIPHDPRFVMASRMELFRSRAANSYLDMFRTICQNRCRIRRTLCHSIVDWDNLQLDAEEIDQELQSFTEEAPVMDLKVSDMPIYAFPLSSWAYFYKLQQMELVVQLGFELNIYQSDELATMYWYLQYLAKTRSRHLERMRGFVVRNYAAALINSGTTGEQKLQYQNALSFIDFSTIEAAAIYSFADALSCFFTVLDRLLLIQHPPRPYSDDRLRYEVRMKPFMSIGLPELVPYDELTKAVAQSDEAAVDLLTFAADCVTAARKRFEILGKLNEKEAFCEGSYSSWLGSVKDCMKACIFTGISIARTQKAIEAVGVDGRVKIEVDLPVSGAGYHDWWIVPKILPLR